MFISSNPAITPRCVFPRWHPAFNGEPEVFTLAGDDAAGNKNYQVTYGAVTQDNMLSVRNVYDFLRDRLSSGQTDNQDRTLAWTMDNNNNFPVRFWYRVLKKIMNMLHPAGNITNKLMRSVLSTEVIFWGSMNEQHATDIDTLKYFWRNFTEPMIQNSGAELIFIVGTRAKRTFGDIYNFYAPSGRNYQLAVIYNFRYAPPTHYTNVISKLTGATHDIQRDPEIMQNVLNRINALY